MEKYQNDGLNLSTKVHDKYLLRAWRILFLEKVLTYLKKIMYYRKDISIEIFQR